MSEGEATWPASSVSLISREHDAVLIDALITFEDAGRVVDWIRASGKNLFSRAPPTPNRSTSP